MKAERNFDLAQRNESVREKVKITVKEFELSEIFEQFEENIRNIKEKFHTANKLLQEGDEESFKDILRLQIVFLDSALDYYMHCITKYGMNKIFKGEWHKTNKYLKFMVPLEQVEHAIKNCEDTNWFLELVNNTYSKDTFMEANSIKEQLNLIDIDLRDIANEVFNEENNKQKRFDKLKEILNKLFYRRNAIAHQSDRLHEDGKKKEISKEEVENYIDYVEKIVISIHKKIENKNSTE